MAVDTKMLKQVQCAFTRAFRQLRDMDCEHGLGALDLYSLERGRKKYDLVQAG